MVRVVAASWRMLSNLVNVEVNGGKSRNLDSRKDKAGDLNVLQIVRPVQFTVWDTNAGVASVHDADLRGRLRH
jgi:hypothetical protein